MQLDSENMILFVAILVIFSIILIWWSSNLMLLRGGVRGGVHVMILGCALAYNAGIVFFGPGGAAAIGMLAVSAALTILSWLYEIHLRKIERSLGIII